MKQEVLTLEQGLLADAFVSLKESHRKINRFTQKYNPLLDGDRFLTDKEVAELLKVSRRTLQEYRSLRILPYYLIQGKVLYKESEIQQLLEEAHRKCLDEQQKWL